MSEYPKVTIMIPAYNQAGFLHLALESALAQDYNNLEVVISDDCSTDNSQEIVNRYIGDPRLKYFRNSTNLGRVANYRQLLEHCASGEWVINLDADDYFIDSGFIKNSIDLIKSHPGKNIVFVQAGHEIRNKDRTLMQIDIPDIEGSNELIDGKTYFLQFSHFSHMAALYNHRKALSISFYRFDILSTDIESFLRLSLLGDVILVKKAIGVWVQHENNETKKLTIAKLEEDLLSIEGPYDFARTGKYIQNEALDKWRKKMIERHIIHHFHTLIRLGLPVRSYLKYVWEKYPFAFFRWLFIKGFLVMLRPGARES